MPTIKTEIDKTIEIELEVEVFCATCGSGLCKGSTAVKTRNRQADAIDVEACPECISNAYDEGYKKAREEFEKEAL